MELRPLKREFLIICLLMIMIPSSHAQDSLKHNPHKLNLGLNVRVAWSFTPYLSYSWDRHQVGLGVLMGKPPEHIIEHNGGSFSAFYKRSSNFSAKAL